MDRVELILFAVFLIGIIILTVKRARILYYFAFSLMLSAALFVYRSLVYESVWVAFTESFGIITIIIGIMGIAAWLRHQQHRRQDNF